PTTTRSSSAPSPCARSDFARGPAIRGNELMQHSTDRILTTHVGSLPRPDDLFEMMLAKMDGQPVDETAYAERVRRAVADIVKQQVATGLDVVNDGEMGK